LSAPNVQCGLRGMAAAPPDAAARLPWMQRRASLSTLALSVVAWHEDCSGSVKRLAHLGCGGGMRDTLGRGSWGVRCGNSLGSKPISATHDLGEDDRDYDGSILMADVNTMGGDARK
jgi:hypothetical protein